MDGGGGSARDGADNELRLRALDQFDQSRACGIIERDLDACSGKENERVREGEDRESGRGGHGCGGGGEGKER